MLLEGHSLFPMQECECDSALSGQRWCSSRARRKSLRNVIPAYLESIGYTDSNSVSALQVELLLYVLCSSVALWEYYSRSGSFAFAK